MQSDDTNLTELIEMAGCQPSEMNTERAEIKSLEDLLSAAVCAKNIGQLMSATSNCVRIDRVSKSSERKAREQLARVYAVLRIAKAMGSVDELAAAIKAEDRWNRVKHPISTILHRFFDYGGDSSGCTRDKAVLEFASDEDIPPERLGKFIRDHDGLYGTYKAFRAKRKGNASAPDVPKRIHGVAPAAFESDGDEFLARLRLKDIKKGIFEFVDCVPLYGRVSEAARQDLIAEIEAISAAAKATAFEPLDKAPDPGLEILFNKEELPDWATPSVGGGENV